MEPSGLKSPLFYQLRNIHSMMITSQAGKKVIWLKKILNPNFITYRSVKLNFEGTGSKSGLKFRRTNGYRVMGDFVFFTIQVVCEKVPEVNKVKLLPRKYTTFCILGLPRK